MRDPSKLTVHNPAIPDLGFSPPPEYQPIGKCEQTSPEAQLIAVRLVPVHGQQLTTAALKQPRVPLAWPWCPCLG